MSQQENAVVAIYRNHADAEAAVRELQKSGFNMKNLSIAAREYETEEQVTGYYNTGDRMKYWGKTGALWGGFWGFLFGSAFFAIPGIGPVLVAGPLVSWIVGALEGAVATGGLSAIAAALFSIGIPKDSVLQYETALRANQFVLLAHGTTEEVAAARDVLHKTHTDQLQTHMKEILQLEAVR